METEKKIQLFALHRYFIWSDRMRVHFDNALRNKEKLDHGSFQIETFLYMSYWYGGLYVLIEGWKELKLSDQKVNSLIESPNVDLLRRYRNGIFHFQKDYYDKRFMDFMSEGENCAVWVRQLRKAFGDYFLKNLPKLEK